MKIKTRSKKSAPIKRGGRTERDPKRPLESVGFEGRGMYSYNYVTNEMELIEEGLTVRFYQGENDYIEFLPNKGYCIARSQGEGLKRLVIRAQASNWFELKAVQSTLDKDGESTAWDESEMKENNADN